MFDMARLETAAALVHRQIGTTPQHAWPLLSRRAGCEVWVKHENHTPIGAFKLRGGLVYVDDLVKHGRPKGLVTATRGNHGQSIPYAARLHGLPVTVFVPEGNSVEKTAAMEGWGAEVVVSGHDFEAARLASVAYAEAEGLHLVPSFHPLLVRGVGSYALELFRAAEGLHTVYVPIGLGSGICGVIAARDALGLSTEVVGVVAEGAEAYALSFEAGRPVSTNAAVTFADGMACRVPVPEALETISKGAARVVRVTDDEIADAVRAIWRDTHNAAEGAGAAAFAALMQERGRMKGKRVGVILCGGNIDTGMLATILHGETPHPM